MFLSHCILNQNACVRDLASQPAVIREMVDHDGKALTFGLVVAGQLVMAVVMDHFGLFGMMKQQLIYD